MESNMNANNSAIGTVVAYFANGEDAQRAIGELREEGFSASAIGAAFHSSRSLMGTSVPVSAVPVSQTDDALTPVGKVGSSTGVSGATSDSSGVTPSGLSTGGGTVVSGAGRPGPIPGAEIPSTVPTSLPSSLRSSGASLLNTEADVRGTVGAPVRETARETADDRPRAAAMAGVYEKSNQSWWDKVKHFFSDDSEAEASRRRPVAVDKSASKFGTGEGQLGIAPEDYNYAYSGSAFESSFSGMGVPQPHARRLSMELGRGGAIITVSAGSEGAKAERILERNRGTVRYEATDLLNDSALGEASDSRVEVFGSVQRAYSPNAQRGIPDRKAS